MALSGLKVIEFAGLAPGPFAGLVLADNGAEVIRVDRPSTPSLDILCRGKKSVAINLNPKFPSGKAAMLRLIASADVLIDPYRPGVMERLGLGPDVFLGEKGINKRLVYARMVGFPRDGPHRDMAGHDINYLALSGVLSILPGKEAPQPPINLLADFAGGGLSCALGILLALIERGKSGRGQVVDTNMVAGSRYVSSFPLLSLLVPSSGMNIGDRGSRLLDGGAPFYGVYTCEDGRWMTVGCLEPQFFAIFIERFAKALPAEFSVGGWRPSAHDQFDRDEWPKMKEYITRGFALHPRDYWTKVFHETDACVLPVLSPEEAASTPIPSPHPLARTWPVPGHDSLHLEPGEHTREVLRGIGLSDREICEMQRAGVVQSKL